MRYFLRQSVYVKYALLFFIFFIAIGSKNSYAQTFNGKSLIWQLDKSNETRLKFKFGTSGINIGGYEGTTIIIENITKQKLLVEVKLTIKDFCNGSKIRTVKVTVNPNSKIGGNTWAGGSEQYDYSTTCAERKKYDSSFSTKIFTVGLEIVSVKDLTAGTGTSGGGSSGNWNSGGENSDSQGNSGNGGNGGNGDVSQNKICPTYGFKMNNTPSYNCVSLEWWALSTKVNMIDANGNFKQSNNPEAKYFTVQFRKQGDVNWTSEKRDNTGRNLHTLAGLDACTKYEARLITICDNNKVSEPSNIIRFTTGCDKPADLIIEEIKDNSAKISSKRRIETIYPCGAVKTRIRYIEFKTNATSWDEVICNFGTPCFLSALTPGTTYRVRARYKYGNDIFSNYTNEVSFTTTGKPDSSNSATSSSGSSGNATGTLKVPAIVGPPNGKKIEGYYFELSWTGVLNATSYEILIANNFKFVNATTFTTATNKFAPSNYGFGPVYYWKVRAKGLNGKYSFWSPVSTFKN